MVVLGFAFKIAAAPMHFWAPDTYQGAPIPAVALIASASKLAGFFLFSRFLVVALPGQAGSASWGHFISGWLPLLAILSLVSMLLGNLLAIAQSNFRRLIAYSAIAHAGYALLAIMAFNERGLAALIYYMFTYGLAVIGIFGVIGLLESRFGEFQIQDLDGLSRRSPLLAVCLMIFTLSLAGIPPLAGFFTKFYIFMAALQTPGLLWLVIVAIATSAISLYYYLLVLKHAWVTDPAEPSDPPPLPWTQMLLLTILALAVLIFGCFPALHVKPLESAAQIRFVAPSTPSVAK